MATTQLNLTSNNNWLDVSQHFADDTRYFLQNTSVDTLKFFISNIAPSNTTVGISVDAGKTIDIQRNVSGNVEKLWFKSAGDISVNYQISLNAIGGNAIDVMGTALTGLTIQPPTAITVTDELIIALGKLQAQFIQSVALGDEISGEVNNFSELPDATLHSFKIYLVKNSSGVIFVNRKSLGFYRSDGTNWALLGGSSELIAEINLRAKLTDVYTKIQADAKYQLQEAGKGLSVENFTTTLKDKLNAIETNATGDLTGTEIGALLFALNNTNNYTDIDKTAVANIQNTVNTAVNNLRDGASGAYDTLMEIQSELQANDTDITTILTNQAKKVGVTAQTFTTAEKLQARTNIDLDNVDNTADPDKPVSNATQTALDGKQKQLVYGNFTTPYTDPGSTTGVVNHNISTLTGGNVPKNFQYSILISSTHVNRYRVIIHSIDTTNISYTVERASGGTNVVDTVTINFSFEL